ncbi:hypothetical protein [Pseudomonas putida]|uniref:hypothetical protein n=1 Tax=Pseudomonas putida TaxID=303 RepID=UPI003AF0D647
MNWPPASPRKSTVAPRALSAWPCCRPTWPKPSQTARYGCSTSAQGSATWRYGWPSAVTK